MASKLVLSLFLLTLMLSEVYGMSAVTSVKSLAIIVKPVLKGWDVSYMMPPGASPLFWKPSPALVQKALNSDLFVETGHWPFEIQIASKRYSMSKPNIPNIIEFKDPARTLASMGFVTYPLPTGDLNPHGWWLYAPNAIQIMGLATGYACKVDPTGCVHYASAYLSEVLKIEKTIQSCYSDVGDLKAVVILPVEVYPLLNFGVKVTWVVQAKGTLVSGFMLRQSEQYLRKSDILVISELSDNLPITKIMINMARKMHKPIVKINVLWGDWNSYTDYLESLCEALRAVR